VNAALHVSAPATSANLGAGFDSAAAALDLWNELELRPAGGGAPFVEIEGEGAAELPRDDQHLSLRAFALVAPTLRYRFRFRNAIPLERGLGSSAASIALGLVAACAATGRELSPDQLLELGLPLEGHADNLAAALRGGVCLAWHVGESVRSARIATELPLASVLVVPEGRVNTRSSRARLPEFVRHEDAVASAAAAALLAAAAVSNDAALLTASFADRLHEPYRVGDNPLLGELRSRPPAGASGSTLSGSGPSVVVWAPAEAAESVAAELRSRFSDVRVLPLAVAGHGARAERAPGAERTGSLAAAGGRV
jgi:homoserine kinase